MNRSLFGQNPISLNELFISMCAALVLFTSVSSAGETSAGPKLEKVRIAYSSLSGNMAPLWITYEKGFFRKYGLDAEIIFIAGGSTTAQALSSGNVSFAQMAGAGAIQSSLRGADVVMIAGLVNTLTFQFFVDSSIRQPAQLKGKDVGVTRYGSSTDFAVRFALDKWQLQPGKDVTLVELGSMPAIFASLETGKIHGAMLSAPTTLKAKRGGFSVLANLQMLGLEYQHTGIATTRALIQSRSDLVQSIMKAYVEGIHYYKKNRRESLTILGKYLKTDDAEALTEIYEDIGLSLVPEKPYPTMRGIQIMLMELAAEDPRAQQAQPEQFVDLRFVEELDSSGFIDRLYKTIPAMVRTGSSSARAMTPEPSPEKGKRAATLDVTKPVPSHPNAQEEMLKHTVEAGDTLGHLSMRYYGDARQWGRIYDANVGTIKNPHFIYVGQKIFIPGAGVSGT